MGGDEFTAQRQALTGALNTAYDELLTVRSTATGLNRRRARLLGALNASHLMAEAAVAVGLAGTWPPARRTLASGKVSWMFTLRLRGARHRRAAHRVRPG